LKPIMYEGLPTNCSPSSVSHKITIFNECLKAVVAGVFVFVGICLGIVLLHANTTLTKLDTTLDAANAEVANIETTRKSIDDLLIKTTTLIIDADDAATDEIAFIKVQNTKLSTTLDAVNGLIAQATKDEHELTVHSVQTVDSVKTMLDTSTATIAGVQPVLSNANITVLTTNDSLKIVNQRLADPAIGQTLANVNSMTTSGASILKDGADEVHQLTHPVKKVGFWAGLNATVMYIKRFIPPLF
jgi:hypothetical protein